MRRLLLLAALLVLPACAADLTTSNDAIDPTLITADQCGALTPSRFAIVNGTATGRDTSDWMDNHFQQPLHFVDTLTTYGDGPTDVRIDIIRGPMTDSHCLTLADSMIYRSYTAVGYLGSN